MSKIPDKKIHNAAKEYLLAYAKFVAWDNHDDMDDTDRWKHTFQILTDNEVDIMDYIHNNLTSKEIQNIKKQIEDDVGEPWEVGMNEELDLLFDE